MALGIIIGAPNLAAKAFTGSQGPKIEIEIEIEIDVPSRVVRDLKISTDRFASQIHTLGDKVKHLENKVVDGLNEVRARELCLERTTRANDDYQKQIAQLAKKLESKSFSRL
jgi:outer membrane murein-binding lipoprotein Lpp